MSTISTTFPFASRFDDRRLWFNDGSCVRLRPEHVNHVWSYDFVSAKTYDGRTVRMLNLIDEHSRECLTIRPERIIANAIRVSDHLLQERLK